MKELKRLQFFIDMSMCSKDKWSHEQIIYREILREQIGALRG